MGAGLVPATIALGQRVESFDSNHLRHALRVIPDDAWLRFLEGCQHEAMAASLFQEFARPLRGTAMRPDIRSEDDELGGGEAAFREALRLDPALTEARLRLGRVLGARDATPTRSKNCGAPPPRSPNRCCSTTRSSSWRSSTRPWTT